MQKKGNMMNKNIESFFTLMGVFAVLILCVFIFLTLFFLAKNFIEEKVNKYQYQHRFDKPPLAACYCKDCVKWNQESGECSDSCNSRHMADCWFCCFAEPMTKEQMKRRERHDRIKY